MKFPVQAAGVLRERGLAGVCSNRLHQGMGLLAKAAANNPKTCPDPNRYVCCPDNNTCTSCCCKGTQICVGNVCVQRGF